MGWSSAVLVGILVGTPAAGVDCGAFEKVIEANLKNIAMAKAEAIGDDSAPRLTNTQLAVANDLHLISLNIDLMKEAGCTLRTIPITGGEYMRHALDCQKVLRPTFGRVQTGIPPECDQMTWQRLRIVSTAPRPQVIQPQQPGAAPFSPIGSEDVTLAKFQQISEGMTYEQVIALVGASDAEPTSITDGTSTSEVYVWRKGTSAAKMKVAFQNGKVVWKTQFKLE